MIVRKIAFFSILTSCACAQSLQTVVVSGDRTPTQDGVFSLMGSPSLGLDGKLVFASFLVGTSNGSANDIGRYYWDGGNLKELLREGDTPSETGGEFFFPSDDPIGPFLSINNDGCVVAATSIRDSDIGSVAGIFLSKPESSNLEAVIYDEQREPFGGSPLESGDRFRHISGDGFVPNFGPDNRAYFIAHIDDANGSGFYPALYRTDCEGTLTRLLISGDMVEGYEFHDFQNEKVFPSTDGSVLVEAQLRSPGDTRTRFALIMIHSSGDRTILVMDGTATPDRLGTFLSAASQSVYNRLPDGRGLFRAAYRTFLGNIHRGTFVIGADSQVFEMEFSKEGLILETAYPILVNDGLVYGADNTGFFALETDSLNFTTIIGDSESIVDGVTFSSRESRLVTNAKGDVLLHANVRRSGLLEEGLYLFRDDEIHQIAVEGQEFNGANLDSVGFYGAGDERYSSFHHNQVLNDQGQVGFLFQLTDDRFGIALWTPPEDASPQDFSPDFDGDGNSDLIWRNSTDGRVVAWFMDGTAIDGYKAIAQVADPNWQIAGSGDFSGDGATDMLWKHSDGRVVAWWLDGTDIAEIRVIAQVLNPAWQIAGVGDLDNDGQSDLIWQNADTGILVAWFMDGTSIRDARAIAQMNNPAWKLSGLGDFDEDGRTDLLWVNGTTGALQVWRMDGASISGYAQAGVLGDTNWQVAGVGDYNADGKVDILWRHSDGRVVFWAMDGTTRSSTEVIGQVSNPNWLLF